MRKKPESKMVSSSYHSVKNNKQHAVVHRSSSTSSTSTSCKRLATTDNTNSNVFQAFKRLLFSRQRPSRTSNKNYLIINIIFVSLLVAQKLNVITAQAFGAGGYGSGMPAAGTPGGNMFQQAMLLDLLDVNERMREAIMMNSMIQSGALGGGAAGAGGAGGAYGMNPALGLTAGDPSLGAAFAAAAAQQVAAGAMPQMQQMNPFLTQQQQGAPSITNKTPYTAFDPLARYELQQQLVPQQQQQQQQALQQQPAPFSGSGSDQAQATLHQAYFAPLQTNVANVGALGLSSSGESSAAGESGAGGPTILHRVPRATNSAIASASTAVSPAVINPRAGGGNLMSNRVPFANTGGYHKKKKGSSWATPAASLGARGHSASGALFKKKHHAAATGPYRQQLGSGGGGGGASAGAFGNHINLKHGKRRPR